MSWTGYLTFPDHITYLIEHKVSKLNYLSKKEDWLECVAGLKKYKNYIWNNMGTEAFKLFPSCLWTFVHHAAYHQAPLSIIQILSIDKYPLSLPDGEGRLPVDHVDSSFSQMYKDLLTPVFKYCILPLELKLIQANFHAVIHDRVESLIKKYNLVLPIISVLLEDISQVTEVYFDVPGMYGGFTYWFEIDKNDKHIIALWSRSSSRLIGNSEQLHKCTSEGWILVKNISL